MLFLNHFQFERPILMGTNIALTPREFCKHTKYSIITKCPAEEGCS